jgi:hypothetical protein
VSRRVVTLAAAVAVLGAAAGTGSAASDTAPFALRPTKACLARHGVAVGAVRPANRRLQALHDLAQKTSREARYRGSVVGLAFQHSTSSASLLYELLQVPKDPLRLERRRNVVLLAPRKPTALRTLVLRCLRS